jgi:subtilisin
MALGALGGAPRTAAQRFLPSISATRFEDNSSLTWGLQAIEITASTSISGQDVRVCVLDTGVDFNHPDFRTRFAEGDTKSFIPDEPSAQDAQGHGTHVCGTVAAPAAHAAERRYGVAPRCKLLVGRVLNSQGEGYDDWILNGIDWAITQNARIISMSLGSERQVGEPYSPLYERVAERVLQERPGTIIVAAAGNESDRPNHTAPVGNPAACPSILSVAACDRDLSVAWFSCREMDGVGAVDLTGPGVDVYSAALGGGYRRLSGTSMATPHIAGLAALWLEAYPDMSASELWDRLKAAAKALGDAADFGAGLARPPSPGT